MDHSQFKQIFIFKVLTTEDADLLLNASSIQTYSAGTVLFYEGDVSDHFLIVLEGSIEIVRSMGTDIERLIKVAGVNDFLGEMSVVGDEKRRTASARTPHGVRVLAIPMDELDAFLRHNPGVIL